jgi:AcrR family transcriptional regulator
MAKADTRGDREGGLAPRQRLSAEVRRRQILDAAAALVLEQGHLPLSLERLAGRVGISKGLIYEYFPIQPDLFNALLVEEQAALRAEGMPDTAEDVGGRSAAHHCADVYLRHIASAGPLAHFILRDAYMAGHVDPAAVRLRDRLIRGFARRARLELRLPTPEAIAAVLLVLAIPEEMGRLVWQGEIPLETARQLLAQLVTSSVTALRPAESADLA